MNRLTFHVKKGDYVRVISGAHKSSEGKVLQILPKKQQVLVEGVRLIKKHTKKSNEHPQGAIIQREGPIHISNVKIADKSDKKAEKKPAKKAAKADAAAEPKAEKKPARKKKEEAAE